MPHLHMPHLHIPPLHHHRKPFQGILMGIRLNETQSVQYRRAVLHYSLRSAFIGSLSATVTSSFELALSGKSSTRRVALLGFSNALRRVDRRFLHILALVLPALAETLSLYVHTLRTANRIKARTLGDGGGQYDRELTKLFVMEQLRHALLGLPRPLRPALSEIPAKGRGTIAMRVIASIAAPLWAVKQIWTALNRYNNGLKTILTISIVRACAISILTYSAATPYPVIKGDSDRPTHLHRHAALEALLEHANTELGHPCKGVRDLDSVDAFIEVALPGLKKSHQLTVLKVLALGLVINGSVSMKDKIIFGRALRAVGGSVFNRVDLSMVVREFQRGRLSADSIERVFEEFGSESGSIRCERGRTAHSVPR
ncbi:hypothetical protein TrRE_jg8783 [Triparma retinervis]|uniref:Uncharacterized protein n=1 Tax=Triparma retinervis TaxID=2557542 RepID=A0A9W7A0Q8_9STRA|nr:hypothetical protein TrRE_jg8783 [Triparma retinervis]